MRKASAATPISKTATAASAESPRAPSILVSAGEASGDLYAAHLVEALRRRLPEASFFGCAGLRMQRAGVEAVVDASRLAVVGLVEVVRHIPRIYGEFRKLIAAARARRPQLAILTDSPDFHLRLAARLRRLGVPVLYLVAPQVWAWRKSRIRTIRRHLDRLLCIFPFEEEFFRRHGVEARYIGHPLARLVRPSLGREAFLRKYRIPPDRPLIVLLPGSRPGEIRRHLAPLAAAVERLRRTRAASFVLALPPGVAPAAGSRFWEPFDRTPIQVIEGDTWNAIAHARLALAASGTVTIEAALLGTPMVAFYRVSRLSWWLGRLLVDVPFYSMVNLIAGKRVVPELMQNELTGEALAGEALRLLDEDCAHRMRQELARVAAALSGDRDPFEEAASAALELLPRGTRDV
jgi:lipid-A-disaccharide synthase